MSIAADLRRLTLLLAATAFCGPALAQWEGWDYDFDQEKKPWKELQAQLPKYPADENLIAFPGAPATGHRYFIDRRSISIGEDGVARYTLVIKTSGGATNVSFEGMRCEAREQKTYALGRPDGTWVRARSPQWRKIEYKSFNPYHYYLFGEAFCRGKFIVPSVEEAIRGLREGREISRD